MYTTLPLLVVMVRTNYRASFKLQKNDGMIRNTSRETINGSIAVNHRAFDDKLQLSFNLANSFVKVDAVFEDVDKVGDILITAYYTRRSVSTRRCLFIKEDGSFWETYSGYEDFNPVAPYTSVPRKRNSRIYWRTSRLNMRLSPV